MKCLRPLAVDAIVICGDKIVFIRRGHEPYKDMPALPGGFVESDETVEQAVLRETKEETGLDAKILKLVGVYSNPRRDPRGPVVSICYVLKATGGSLLASDDTSASSDAAATAFLPLSEVPQLAFDHNDMIDHAREYIHGILSEV
jgi:8-oxo-dGTP diphosphatase